MSKIEKIKETILKKEIILYVTFGIFTTVINLGSFYIMSNILEWNQNVSNIIAILLAVIFAYITNRNLVFHSQAKKIREKMKEFLKFMLGRLFTMAIEFFSGIVLFQMPIPKIISKFIITVLVIILNFFISNFFTFSKKSA